MISEYLIISNVLTEEECVDSITSIELDRSAQFSKIPCFLKRILPETLAKI